MKDNGRACAIMHGLLWCKMKVFQKMFGGVGNNCVSLQAKTIKKGIIMSTATLASLRDYLFGTLSTSEMIWLVEEMKKHMRAPEEKLKPYTMEELNARIDQSERDIAEGRVYEFDDVMRELEEDC